jgi:hypothetical protein
MIEIDVVRILPRRAPRGLTCHGCRTSKVKCDLQRPCIRCKRLNLDCCDFKKGPRDSATGASCPLSPEQTLGGKGACE